MGRGGWKTLPGLFMQIRPTDRHWPKGLLASSRTACDEDDDDDEEVRCPTLRNNDTRGGAIVQRLAGWAAARGRSREPVVIRPYQMLRHCPGQSHVKKTVAASILIPFATHPFRNALLAESIMQINALSAGKGQGNTKVKRRTEKKRIA